jgi:hypothetical protein
MRMKTLNLTKFYSTRKKNKFAFQILRPSVIGENVRNRKSIFYFKIYFLSFGKILSLYIQQRTRKCAFIINEDTVLNILPLIMQVTPVTYGIDRIQQ